MIYFDPGTEHHVPTAKRFAAKVGGLRLSLGVPVLSRSTYLSDGTLVWVQDSAYGRKIRITGGSNRDRFVYNSKYHRLLGSTLLESSPVYTPTAGDPFSGWQRSYRPGGGTVVQIGVDNSAAQDMVITRDGVTHTAEDVYAYDPDPFPCFNGAYGLFASNKTLYRPTPYTASGIYGDLRPDATPGLVPDISISPGGKRVVALSARTDETFVVATYDDTAAEFSTTRYGFPTYIQDRIDALTATADVTRVYTAPPSSRWGSFAFDTGLGATLVNPGADVFGGWQTGGTLTVDDAVDRIAVRMVPLVHPFSTKKALLAYQFGAWTSITPLFSGAGNDYYALEGVMYFGLAELDPVTGEWASVIDETVSLENNAVVGGSIFTALTATLDSFGTPLDGILVFFCPDGTYTVARKAVASYPASRETYDITDGGSTVYGSLTTKLPGPAKITAVQSSDIEVGGLAWFSGYNLTRTGNANGIEWDEGFVRAQLGTEAILLSEADLSADRFYRHTATTPQTESSTAAPVGVSSISGRWSFDGDSPVDIYKDGVWVADTSAITDYDTHTLLAPSATRNGVFVIRKSDSGLILDPQMAVMQVSYNESTETYSVRTLRTIPLSLTFAASGISTAAALAAAAADDLGYLSITALCVDTGQLEADWLAAAQDFLDADTAGFVDLYLEARLIVLGFGTEQEMVDDYYGEGGHTIEEMHADLTAYFDGLVNPSPTVWTYDWALPDECIAAA